MFRIFSRLTCYNQDKLGRVLRIEVYGSITYIKSKAFTLTRRFIAECGFPNLLILEWNIVGLVSWSCASEGCNILRSSPHTLTLHLLYCSNRYHTTHTTHDRLRNRLKTNHCFVTPIPFYHRALFFDKKKMALSFGTPTVLLVQDYITSLIFCIELTGRTVTHSPNSYTMTLLHTNYSYPSHSKLATSIT